MHALAPCTRADVKCIHVMEEEVPVPLLVDDEGLVVVVPLEEEETIRTLGPVVMIVTSLMFKCVFCTLIIIINLQIKPNSQIPFDFESNSKARTVLIFNSKSVAI
jgi:hypothetical protein